MKRIPTTVPDLQEISTAAVCISLWSRWSRMPIPDTAYIRSDWKCGVMPLVSKSAKKLPLPNHITEVIEKYALKICEEMINWVFYHFHTIFLSRGCIFDFGRLVSHIAWYLNGTINYKQTARNLQNSDRLSNAEKYRLSCTYCLEEDIKQKWSVLFDNDALDHIDLLRYRPLIVYWNCYCKNELDKMPVTRSVSLDSFMFQHKSVDNWHAKEYFFNRMNDEEKMRNAVSMIETETFPWQKEMLLKLNENQRIQLYVERPVKVMANYVTHDSVEDALSVWFIIKGLITSEQFVTMVRKLCECKCNADLVTEIWTSASSEFQHRLSSNVNNESFTICWQHCVERYQFESYKRLFDTSEDIRKVIREKEIFRTHCKTLIDKDKIPLLERLLNFCFRNEEELAQFKHRHIHSTLWFREHCEKVVSKRRSYDLDHFERLWGVCFCNEEEFIEFGKAFTKADKFSSYCKYLIMKKPYSTAPSSSSLSTLERLLNVLLPRTEDLSQFKRDFTQQTYTLHFFKQLIYRDEFPIDRLRDLCDLFPWPAKDLTRLKEYLTNERFFFNHCKSLIECGKSKELQEKFNFLFGKPQQSE